jgi:3-oxoacyl-[acyl-carrier-protein] synthase II
VSVTTRVVITGSGAVTPIGATREQFWAAALRGADGVSQLEFEELPPSRRIWGGQLKAAQFNHEQFTPRQQMLLSDAARYAVVAAREAMAEAGLSATCDHSSRALDRWRVGVCIGSGTGNPRHTGGAALIWKTQGLAAVPKRILWKGPATSITAALAAEFGACGPNHVFTTSCMAGNNAIAYAADLIASGRADVMLTGGAEAMTWVAANGFRMLTTTKGESVERSQPFSADRRGVVIGEGAGVLVLESARHARDRGATALAEILGCGFASDAYHMSTPHPAGLGGIAAVRQGLERAGIGAGAVDYVSAHGTGSQANDVVETRIFKTVFGDRAAHVPISSIKSMLGHTLGAASAIEAIACVLAIRDGRIPPTINYTTPDPACDLDWVPNHSRAHRVDVALSTAFAFGGACSALVIGRPGTVEEACHA